MEPLLKISERNTSSDGSFSLQSLPEVMANMHNFFIHVAAKVYIYKHFAIAVDVPCNSFECIALCCDIFSLEKCSKYMDIFFSRVTFDGKRVYIYNLLPFIMK